MHVAAQSHLKVNGSRKASLATAIWCAVKERGGASLGCFKYPLAALEVFLAGTKKDQRHKLLILFILYGAPGRIRTSDTLIRSQVLYPAELQALNLRLFDRPQMRENSRATRRPIRAGRRGESIQQRFELGYTRHARVFNFGVSPSCMGFSSGLYGNAICIDNPPIAAFL